MRLKSILYFLDEVSGSLVGLHLANHKLTALLRQLKKEDPESAYRDDARAGLAVDLLMRHLDQEHARRRVIEDKARTNVLGIALAFSALFAGVALMSSRSTTSECNVDWQLWVFLALLVPGGYFPIGWRGSRTPCFPYRADLYLDVRGRN